MRKSKSSSESVDSKDSSKGSGYLGAASQPGRLLSSIASRMSLKPPLHPSHQDQQQQQGRRRSSLDQPTLTSEPEAYRSNENISSSKSSFFSDVPPIDTASHDRLLKARMSALSSANRDGILEESVKHLQLVNALGTNDLDSVLAAIMRLTSIPSPAGSPPLSYGSPLHLVMSLCQKSIVKSIISTFCMPGSDSATRGNSLQWINTPNSPDGETPLHIASKLGRVEIAEELFHIPNIDDTIRNSNGKTAEELAKNDKTLALFENQRQLFCDSIVSTIRTHLFSGMSKPVIDLFASNDRARSYLSLGWIDINAPIDTATDRSILHFAAKMDDLTLVNWTLSQGADPNVKDKKEKKPLDLCKKDKIKDRLKNAISQTPIQSLNLAQSSTFAGMSSAMRALHEAPVLKGALFKWTNYTTGYKSRYFVLENGSLSYYHTPDEYPNSCRGSISTMTANVTMPDSNDASRFDVMASGNVRYSIKARSPADAKKWVWYLMESKRFSIDMRNLPQGTTPGLGKPVSGENDTMGSLELGLSGYTDDLWDRDKDPAEAVGDTVPLDDPLLSKVATACHIIKNQNTEIVDTIAHSLHTKENTDAVASMSLGHTESDGEMRDASAAAFISTPPENQEDSLLQRHSILVKSDHLSRLSISGPSTGPNIHTLLYMLEMQLQTQKRVVDTVMCNLLDSTHQPPLTSSSDDTRAKTLTQLSELFKESVEHVQDTAKRIVELYSFRERMWSRRLRKEVESRKRWEEVVSRVVGIDHHAGTEPFGSVNHSGDSIDPSANHNATTPKAGGAFSVPNSSMVTANTQFTDVAQNGSIGNITNASKPLISKKSGSYRSIKAPNDNFTSSDNRGRDELGDEDVEEEDDEGHESDVFYDADDDYDRPTESFLENALGFSAMDDPSYEQSHTREPPTLPAIKSQDSSIFLDHASLQLSGFGYDAEGKPRAKLPLDPTTPKPALAVWSFLKSAIGKDLSKVTLPVFFNEPLSMLQRMCEDVEYIELLSLASRVGSHHYLEKPHMDQMKLADQADPAADAASFLGIDIDQIERLQGDDAGLMRLMLVAAYGMSNYSSTVGRTNKPFNPMLGETYELVRLDKRLRYLSEQVCHHPPISACFCHSPDYTFWTEVNVKSKFWGRSLELHPLGTCHVALPVHQLDAETGRMRVTGSEHYSWKKVTTGVNNLIVGKLSIDHYGDMVVRNWQTGEECVLTFKPKDVGGWFGSSSKDDGGMGGSGGDIEGRVKDATGRVRFEIKGKWDTSLIATPVATMNGSKGGNNSLLLNPIVIWKRNALPACSQQNFNYTSFALSLNEINSTLETVLPPTDSRLRPDQRYMERGMWEIANTDKERLELIQREKRKQHVAQFASTGIPSGPVRPEAEIGSNAVTPLGEPWWTPRWFVREVEPDSNEEHWRFTHEYWDVRQKAVVALQATNEENRGAPIWPDYVNDIFGLQK
ncbi:hypothetical protein BASA50_000046 [Batrachochytrium salamandrivorans]|uniref:PH domain-containing protein n=1 Tax=Batrachochytrium salamandrivorans TaxID=1357716 RepID=A0ABQ8EUY9_9FUNG|nr:hypothetical protein BASA50_000046 [Batrachochytrium salamandrivorans]KAH9271587.1 hypothetical protein BASA83_006197 [Batrachochytrium salamandrivorans]